MPAVNELQEQMTINAARQNLEQMRVQLQNKSQEALQAERAVQAQKESLFSQQNVRQQGLEGFRVRGINYNIIKQNEQGIESYKKQIQSQQEELSKYEKEVLTPAEERQKTYERELAKQQDLRNVYLNATEYNPPETTKVYEIPRKVLTPDGIFTEYKSGERVKVGEFLPKITVEKPNQIVSSPKDLTNQLMSLNLFTLSGKMIPLNIPSTTETIQQITSDIGRVVQGKSVGGGLYYSKNIPQNIIPTPKYKEPTFLERYKEATAPYSLVPGVNIAPGHAYNFFVGEAGKALAEPVYLQVVSPTLFKPKQINPPNYSEIKNIITPVTTFEAAATPVGISLLSGNPELLGSMGFVTASSGAEQLFTKAGKEQLISKTMNEYGGTPVPFLLPTAELVLGGLAVGQAFKTYQLGKIQAAKPEIVKENVYPEIIDNKPTGRLIIEQYGIKKIPYPGFTYTPKSEFSNEFGTFLSKSNFVEPRIDTLSKIYLTPSKAGNFYYISGNDKLAGVSQLSYISPFTGKDVQKINVFSIGGTVEPTIGRSTKFRIIENPITGVKSNLYTDIENAYSGELRVTSLNDKSIKEFFGGFPVKTIGENEIVVSGDITKARLYPSGEYKGILNPRTLGIITEETPTRDIFFGIPLKDKGAQLFPQLEPLEVTPSFEVGTTTPTKQIISNIIGQRISTLAPRLFSFSNVGVSPIESFFGKTSPAETIKSKQQQIQLQFNPPSNRFLYETSIKNKPDQISTTSLVPRIIEIPGQKINLAQLSEQAQLLQSKTIQPISFSTQQITQEIPQKDIFTMNVTNKKSKKSISKRKAYSVLVKRKGKFFEIAKGLPQGKALKVGAEKALGTLARTFQLKQVGETEQLDISYFPSSKLFRAPKRPTGNPLTFVQRQALNRGTGEVPEIQAFRRSKSNIFKSSKKTRRFKLFK